MASAICGSVLLGVVGLRREARSWPVARLQPGTTVGRRESGSAGVMPASGLASAQLAARVRRNGRLKRGPVDMIGQLRNQHGGNGALVTG